MGSAQPTRLYYIAGFAVGTTLLSMLLEPLSRRPAGSLLMCVLTVSTLVVSLALAYFLSERFGMTSLVAAAALAGGGLGALRWSINAVRGLIPLYSILVGGLVLVGYVDSVQSFPSHAMLLLPGAPLALWSITAGPLSRWTGLAAAAAQFGRCSCYLRLDRACSGLDSNPSSSRTSNRLQCGR